MNALLCCERSQTKEFEFPFFDFKLKKEKQFWKVKSSFFASKFDLYSNKRRFEKFEGNYFPRYLLKNQSIYKNYTTFWLEIWVLGSVLQISELEEKRSPVPHALWIKS